MQMGMELPVGCIPIEGPKRHDVGMNHLCATILASLLG